MVRVICNEASVTGERAGIGTSDLEDRPRSGGPQKFENEHLHYYRGNKPSLYRDGIRKKTGEISSTTMEITSRTCLRRSRMKL